MADIETNTVVEQVQDVVAPEQQTAPPAPVASTAPSIPPAFQETEPTQFDDTSYADDEGVSPPTVATAQDDEPPQGSPAPVPAPAPAPQDSAQAQPAAQEFPEHLLAQAGVTAEEAKTHFGTPDALQRMVRMMDARAASAGRQYLEGRQQQQYQAPQQQYQPPQQQYQATQQQPQPQQQPVDWLPPPESGGDWDPETKYIAQALQARYSSELSKRDAAILQQQHVLAALVEQQQTQARVAHVQEFDGFIEKLGEAWKPVFGVGSGWSLPTNSIMIQNRSHLDQVASQIAAGYELQGRQPLSRTELLGKALYAAFPEIQQQIVTEDVTHQVTSRQNSFTARPTQRRAAALTADDRAAAAAENWFKSRNMAVETDEFDYSEV